ncbi:MAG: cbb3-type cytochrome c oxidase N-terminal domain-containing protein [Saprospiraceae bacterium]
MNRLLSLILVYTLVLFSGVHLIAQESTVTAGQTTKSNILDLIFDNIILVMAIIVLIGVVFTALNLVWALIDLQKIKLIDEYGPDVIEKAGWSKKSSMWSLLYDKLSGLKPMEQENTIELDHEYDGIRELDNSLPPWWLYMFYITIIWGIGYFIYYHASDWGISQEKEYLMALEEAEVEKSAFLATQADMVDEKNVTLLTDEASLAEGKEVFLANCLACHGANGEGNAVGPNLTDKYWLNGGGITNVFSTIKYGVQEKGMQPWQAQLRPQIIQKVSSYILSLQGSNPPNAKEPQGELYDESSEKSDNTETKTDTTVVK